MKKVIFIILVFVATFSANIVNAQWVQTNGAGYRFTKSLVINGSSIFAGTYNAGIYKSNDNGNTWAAVNNGLTNYHIWALAISGSDLFAGTYGGGVFLSSDNGNTWTPFNTGLTNLDIISLAINGSNIFAGTHDGGVFYNNGSTWTPASSGLPTPSNCDIRALAINPDSAGVIYAGLESSGMGNRGIWKSNNYGTTWT